ncbi:DUF2793 domain-containing protein [Parapedomonas caeni]
MSGQTDRHGLPLLAAGQAQKEVSHNEALLAIDGLLHAAVEAVGLTTPPVAPEPGQAWIVGAGATGAWAGQDGALALHTVGGWRFFAARAGMLAWLPAESVFVRHDGSQWLAGDWPVAQLRVDGQRVVGARRPAITGPAGGGVVDTQARDIIEAILSALRAHGLIDAA